MTKMKLSLTDRLIDKLERVDAGVRELISLGVLTTTLLGAGITHEYIWRNYTETGKEWVRNVDARYEELKQDPALSNYDRTAKIVSEFYGLR